MRLSSVTRAIGPSGHGLQEEVVLKPHLAHCRALEFVHERFNLLDLWAPSKENVSSDDGAHRCLPGAMAEQEFVFASRRAPVYGTRGMVQQLGRSLAAFALEFLMGLPSSSTCNLMGAMWPCSEEPDRQTVGVFRGGGFGQPRAGTHSSPQG